MDEEIILHALKELGMDVVDLHARINSIEAKLEKYNDLKHMCTCEESQCEDGQTI